MAVYRLEVMRRGIIVVDDVDSLEDAEEYIENCNLVDEVNWSDFLETVQGGTELQKISVPDSMAIKEFADKMEVLPSEIIRRLFLRGKVENLGSEICFDDMKEFADKYGVICEKEAEKKNIYYDIKNIVFHIDPIEFYDNMIDFPVMGMEEIPDCFKDEVNQAISQAISEFVENNNILDTSNLILEFSIRVQVVLANKETVCQFVVIVLDSGYKYDHVSKNVIVKDTACLFEFKKYYTKKLEALFFGDVKAIGESDNGNGYTI